MGKSKFNLKKPSSKNDTLIVLKMHLGEKTPVTISTEEKIKPSQWNKAKQRAKGKSPKILKLNQYLDWFENMANEVYRKQIQSNQKPTNTIIKNLILKKLNRIQSNEFSDYFEKHIERKKINGEDTRQVVNTLRRLKEYDSNLTFESITIDFYFDFLDFLYKRGYSKNSVGIRIKNIKSIMAAAAEEKPPLHNNFDFKKRKFKKLTAPSHQIALNENQINALYNCEGLTESQEIIKDWFIAACETGLRRQSWKEIKQENIKIRDGVKILEIFIPKTQNIVAIPVFERLEEILKKYGGEMPPLFSSKEVNKKIKIIAEIAGLTQETTKIIHKKEDEIIKIPFCERITQHTARRTFVTFMKSKGVQDSDIQKMTGHKSIKTLSIYDKETAVNSAVKIVKSGILDKKLRIVK